MDNIIWKDIEGYEGMYQVSNTALVRSLDRYSKRYSSSVWVKGQMIAILTNNSGYHYVTLKNKNHFVHRLVAIAFIPNPNNLPLVRHWDNDKKNNAIDNLAWGTHRENMRDVRMANINKKIVWY